MENKKLCGGNCASCFISKSPEASVVNKVMRQLVTEFGDPAKNIIEEECPVLAARLDVKQQGDCGGLGCHIFEARLAAEKQGKCDGLTRSCYDCSVAKNGCGASQQLARLLNRMYVAFGRDAYRIIEGTCPSMTVCPECRIDDFCHVVDDYGNVMCDVERYAFSDLELAAGNAGCNDWQTKTKDTARWQAQEWLVKHGYLSEEDDANDEITEGDVDELCERLMFRFDGKGNMVYPK